MCSPSSRPNGPWCKDDSYRGTELLYTVPLCHPDGAVFLAPEDLCNSVCGAYAAWDCIGPPACKNAGHQDGKTADDIKS